MKVLKHTLTLALITVAIAFAAPKSTNVTAADQTARIGMPGGTSAGDSSGNNQTARVGMPGGTSAGDNDTDRAGMPGGT